MSGGAGGRGSKQGNTFFTVQGCVNSTRGFDPHMQNILLIPMYRSYIVDSIAAKSFEFIYFNFSAPEPLGEP